MDDELDPGDDHTAALVRQAIAGDDAAFGRLYDEWFDRVFDAASRVVRDRSAAGDVAQDAFLRAWRSLGSLRDPALFGGWLLRITRNTALNHATREARAGAVDAEGLAMIERAGTASPTAPAGFGVADGLGRAEDPAIAVEDAELVELVQESARVLEGRDAEVLDLGLRYGLSPAEIGEALGLNRNAANQAVHRARGRLRAAVEARVLWHGGAPRCDLLAAALTAASIDRFDRRAAEVVSAHAARCDVCSEHRRLRLEPSALFAAVPLVPAPALLKSKVAAALSDAGVPMSGSAAAPGASGSTGSGSTESPASASGSTRSEPGANVASSTDAGSADRPLADGPGSEPESVETGAGPVSELRAPEARGGRRRRAAVFAGVLLALVVAAVVGSAVLADDEERDVTTRSPRTTTTTVPTTTTTPVTTVGPLAPATTAPEAPPVTTSAPVAPATTEPPPPPPPEVTASLVISPATVPRPWTMAGSGPRLSWDTEHAATVTVAGPGVSSDMLDGSVLVCPTGTSASLCNPPPNRYRYVLVASDDAGAIVAIREVYLEVR